jgi:hypothetical protein
VGFAESACDFEASAGDAPSAAPSPGPSAVPSPPPLMPPEWRPAGPCDAQCDPSPQGQGEGQKQGEGQRSDAYTAVGAQTWLDVADGVTTVDRTCTVLCARDNSLLFAPPPPPGGGNASASASCPEGAWGECSAGCMQTRPLLAPPGPAAGAGECTTAPASAALTQACYAGACPVAPGDYVVRLALAFSYPMPRWSQAVSADLARALSNVLQVPVRNIAVSCNESATTRPPAAAGAGALSYQLHVEVRESGGGGGGQSAGEALVNSVKLGSADGFVAGLLAALDAASATFSRADYSVYGWMAPADIRVREGGREGAIGLG